MDRRFPLIPFDPQCFAPFFGEAASALKGHLLPGGACNSNYMVTNGAGEKFVCRIRSRGLPETERYMARLAKEAVPSVEYLWVGENASVMAYIEGAHFVPTPALMQEAGQLIARMSRISFESSGEIRCDGSIKKFTGWDSCRGGLMALLEREDVRQRLENEVVDELKKIIDLNAAIREGFDRSRNLVHGDFRPDNILVSEGSIVGVLDWEFGHSGSSFMDIGNLLRHFPATFDHDLAKGLEFEGFELPANWRFQALLIDLTNHLEFLTSGRSNEFKRECAERIEHFIRIHRAQ